jgi:hypothetical protein
MVLLAPVIATGIRAALGSIFTGILTALGTFLIQGVLMGGMVVVGWYFRDAIFDFLSDAINYVVAGLNGVGLNIPTISEVLGALPQSILVLLKRVAFDEALSILLTAVAVRAVVGFFKWVRAFNMMGPQ